MKENDAIVAPATALGGAIAILRLSGSGVHEHVRRHWQGRGGQGARVTRALCLGRWCDAAGRVIDQVCVVLFRAGHSYTGETMAEIHCHGSSVAVRAILETLYRAGVRPAAPGEFTRRAFLNGKMDLTQAEAVADIISARTPAALRAAEAQSEGVLKRQTEAILDALVRLQAEIESRLDFGDEQLDWWPAERLAATAQEVENQMATLLASRRRGAILRDGFRVILAGGPNSGKSSLLNAIVGRERAIVTPIPGTTRDTLEETVNIDGVPVCFIDTAGIRDTQDPVERSGIERTVQATQQADLILWVVDSAAGQASPTVPASFATGRWLPVFNKTDIASAAQLAAARQGYPGPPGVTVSALTGAGLEELLGAIAAQAGGGAGEFPDIAVNERHAILLEHARAQVRDGAQHAHAARWELAAVHARAAVHDIGLITGRTHAPDVLDSIFSRFCIGK